MTPATPRDLVRGTRSFLLLWGIPLALVLVGLVWASARVWFWTPAGALAGLGCLVNASRCGRLHCFITGPLFLAGAALTVLSHLAVVQIGEVWLLGAMIVGTVIGYAAEWIRGDYVGANGCAADHHPT